MTTYVGKPVRRVEDHRFITGRGRYVDDIKLPGMVYAYIVRSPYAHAKILSIDTSQASTAPGVIAVFTGKDLEADGIGGLPCGWQVDFRDGTQMKEPRHPVIAVDKVRHVGEPVAVIIAETREQAKDAAELLRIEYEELPAVVDPQKAIENGAPLVHDDAPRNLAFDWEIGDKAKTEAAFQEADRIVELELENQRLVPNAIEPRAAIGDYNPGTDHTTLYTTSQNPHLIRLLLCAFVMGLPEHKVRVVSPDVGGGFGSKIFHYNEEVIVTWAARKLKRPVKWTAERSESFLSDRHGRDHRTKVQLALKNDGTFLGLKVRTYANLGAYLSTFAPAIPTYLYGTLLQGVYTTPAIYCEVYGVFTHTVPVDAYRGAGRPEATYLLERIVDLAARELNMDPADIRKKNFIPPFDGIEQPGYQTQVALQYDSGNYEAALNRLLEMANYSEWRRKQQELRSQGRYIGLGLSTYIEACGIAPSAVVGALGARAGLYDSATVRVHPTGKVSVYVGVHAHGQGHETTFAQIVADKLGIALEDVEIVHGDTAEIPFGMGTYGSRSLAVGGSAMVRALDKILEKATKIAAHLLEAPESDLEFREGRWYVKGTEKSISFPEVALAAYVPHNYPPDLEPGLEAESFYDPKNFTFPFGAHLAIVEVDPETGEVKLLDYYAVDDFGNIVNPLVVEGQVHGGIVQGVGQALYEEARYDENGQLLTGTFLEYAMPRADEFPMFKVDHTVTPCPHNPLGAKGAGETGTIAATAAVANAVADALQPFGVKHVPMPMTPQRVWTAIQASQQVS